MVRRPALLDTARGLEHISATLPAARFAPYPLPCLFPRPRWAGLTQGFGDLGGKKGEIKVPLLVVHGDRDKVTSRPAAARLAEAAASTDKKFVEVPGGYHEVGRVGGLGRAGHRVRWRLGGGEAGERELYYRE